MGRKILRAYGLDQPMINVPNMPKNANRAPTINDKDYAVGDTWVYQPTADTSTSYIYGGNNSSGEAIWIVQGVSAGSLDSINSVVPVAGNIDFTSTDSSVTITTAAGSVNLAVSIDTAVTKYVVDPDGSADYTTIQAALTAANVIGSAAMIYVRPGTYTEDLTIYAGQSIVGDGINTVIIGQHTPPLAGVIQFTDCYLQAAGTESIIYTASTGAGHMVFQDCSFKVADGWVALLPDWSGDITIKNCEDFSTTANGVVSSTGAGDIRIYDTRGGLGTTRSLTKAGSGTLRIYNSYLYCPISVAGASTAVIGMGSVFTDPITTADTSNTYVFSTQIGTSALSAFTHNSSGDLVITNSNIDSNNVNAIAGTGTVTLGSVTFADSFGFAVTLTVNPAEGTIINRRVKSLSFDTDVAAAGVILSGTTLAADGTDVNIPITITPKGSGAVVLDGLSYPVADGAASQVMVTDGAGTLSFSTVSGSAITLYIVDGAGVTAYTTIQSALTAANAAGLAAMIYVRPGTYTEDLTIYSDQMIVGEDLNTIIIGQHTPPATGEFEFRNCYLKATGTDSIIFSAAAGTGHLVIESCYFVVANGYIANLANWTGNIVIRGCEDYSTAINGIALSNGSGDINLFDSRLGVGTVNSLTKGGSGSLRIYSCLLYVPISIAGTCSLVVTVGTYFGDPITTADTANVFMFNSTIQTGALSSFIHNSAGSFEIYDNSITSSNVSVITGTGTVTLGPNIFMDSSTLAGTLTVNRTGRIVSNDIDSSTITVDDETAKFITLSGDRIAFNASPILQTQLDTGGVPTGANSDVNIMSFQHGITMEQFIIGTQTIIAPRVDSGGLLASLDLNATDGWELSFGADRTTSRHAYTIGTDDAFYFQLQYTVADCGGCTPTTIGFRKTQSNNATFISYTDFASIGLNSGINADTVIIQSRLNSGGVTSTNTTDAWTDGQTHVLRVLVSAAGVVTYTIDGAPPSVTAAFTFDNGDIVHPFIHHLFGVATPGAIHLVSMETGYQY